MDDSSAVDFQQSTDCGNVCTFNDKLDFRPASEIRTRFGLTADSDEWFDFCGSDSYVHRFSMFIDHWPLNRRTQIHVREFAFREAVSQLSDELADVSSFSASQDHSDLSALTIEIQSLQRIMANDFSQYRQNATFVLMEIAFRFARDGQHQAEFSFLPP